MDAHVLWSVERRAEVKVCDVECHETSAFFGDGGIEEEFHSREIGSEGGSFTLVVGKVATVGAADAALYDIVFDLLRGFMNRITWWSSRSFTKSMCSSCRHRVASGPRRASRMVRGTCSSGVETTGAAKNLAEMEAAANRAGSSMSCGCGSSMRRTKDRSARRARRRPRRYALRPG